MDSNRAERRRETRHEIVARARITAGSSETTLDIVNVSRSGMLINLAGIRRPEWLDIEQKLSIVVTVPKGHPVEVHGTIVRIVEDRRFRAFAVEFGELSEGARAGIETVVADAVKKAAPPPLPPVAK